MHLVLAVASAIAYGGSDFLGGLASRRAAILPVVVASQGLALVLAVLVAPLVEGTAAGAGDYAWGAVAGLAYGTGVYLLYRGLARGPMSVVAPVAGVCGIGFPVAWGLVIGEQPSLFALGGIVLAATAVVLISREPGSSADNVRRERTARGLTLTAIGAGVAFGAFFVALSRTSVDSGLWPLVATRLVVVVGFVTMAVSMRASLRLDATVLTLALAGGGLDIAANCFYLLAVRGSMISLVATLTSLYPAATVVLAAFVLRERIRAVQALGLLFAAASVVAISVARGS